MGEIKSYKADDQSVPDFGDEYKVIDHIVLNMTNISGNNNKFYSMELQECKGEYRIFTHYGRVGAEGVKESRFFFKKEHKEEDGKTLDEIILERAKLEFTRIKTSKEKKGYVAVEMAAADVGSEKVKEIIHEENKTVARTTNLDTRVQRLVEQIYEEASRTLSNTIRTPLGALSQTQIDKGYEKLQQLRKAIKYNDNRLVTELSSQYYSLIPQKFPHKIDTREVLINDEHKADRQEELLQLMRDVFKVRDSMDSDIVAKYKAINTKINPLERNNEEYERIKENVLSTQSRHHNFTLDVKDIFEVEQYSTKDRFNPKKLTTIELYHGSANRNILGILERGLLIAPPCAAFTGAAFGRGIYFARHSTKSAQYSVKFYNNIHKNGFLFVANVAVGKMLECRHYTFSGPRTGYDSVKGIAGADLIHDEFIVYNTNQVELKYLVEFMPRWR
jgi:poly [ADP-ribose] polymerase